MQNTRTKNAVRNITGGISQKLVSMLFPYLIQTVMVYTIGDLYWGLNSLFTSIFQVLNMAELGFGTAMVFSMYAPLANGDRQTVCALLRLYRRVCRIVGCVILGLGLAVLPLLAHLIHGETPAGVNLYVIYLIQLSATVVSYFMYAYQSALLTANQRSDISSYIGMGVTVVSGIVSLLALWLMRSYYAYCVILPLNHVLTNLITHRVVKKMYPEYTCAGELDASVTADIRKRVSGLFLYKVCGVFRDSFDSLVISGFLGLFVLGVYQRYFMIQNSLYGLLTILPNAVTAGIGHSLVTESPRKNYLDFRKFQFLFMWLSIWSTAALFCLYQPFLRIWMGESRMFPDAVMAVFCAYYFCRNLGVICFQYRQAAGLWWQDRVRPVVEAATNLVLNVVLVKFFGVTGVLWSTIFCLVFLNAGWGAHVLYRHYFRQEKLSAYLLRLAGYSAAALVTCAVTGWCCRWISVGGFAGLALRGVVCLIVPNICLCLALFPFPERAEAFRFLTKAVRYRLPNRRAGAR